MSRHEGEFNAVAAAPLDLAAQLHAQVRSGKATGNRVEAVACCLSASEGWRSAARTLGGAFAGDTARTGLTAAQEE